MDKAYFPMFVDIADKRILMVGGGSIAARRVKTLLSFGGDITIVAPEICDAMRVLIEQYNCRLIKRKWQPEDMNGYHIVLAATNDRKINSEIGARCRANNQLVNVADDKSKCDFYFPGIVQQEDITIGISTSGNSPAKVKQVREKLVKMLAGKSVGEVPDEAD